MSKHAKRRANRRKKNQETGEDEEGDES